MKFAILSIGAIAILGFGAYGFMQSSEIENNESKHGNCDSAYTPIDHLNDIFDDFNINDIDNPKLFHINGNYRFPISKEKLSQAESLSDIISYYPEEWIKNYRSVDLTVSNDDNHTKITGDSHQLTTSQKELLSDISLAADVNIKVGYQRENDVTGLLEDQQMDVTYTVIPSKEAKFSEDEDALRSYLNSAYATGFSTYERDKLNATIFFTIDEKGQVTDIKLDNSTGEDEVDKELIQLISNMPTWIPAENEDGTNVSQEFVFTSGFLGC